MINLTVLLLLFILIAFSNGVFPPEMMPLYCSSVTRKKDRERYIEDREIPELTTSIKGAKLRQVQVLIRHGARTLYEPFSCWPGYESKFDCSKSAEVITASDPETRMLSFVKRFDMRPDVQLSGGCGYGQLIDEGYEQQKINGEVIAKTYFPEDSPLFDVKAAISSGELNDKIFFRASEFERTRLSGGQLISSLLTSIDQKASYLSVELHTVDQFVDMLFPNDRRCKDLGDIRNKAFSSSAYTEKYGERHRKAREIADKLFELEAKQPHAWPREVMDCLLTTICTGKELPDSINPTDVKTVLQAVDEEWQFEWRYNNAEFSKKAGSRLMVEIKAFMIKIFPELLWKSEVNTTEYEEVYSKVPIIQKIPFILWSGHDSTVAPFMATFGEKMWEATGEYGSSFPPYGTMIVLEVYGSSEGPMIRLIYNSKVLTKHIDGCPQNDDLCSIETFFKATSWATPEEAFRGCQVGVPAKFEWTFAVNLSKSRNLRQHQN